MTSNHLLSASLFAELFQHNIVSADGQIIASPNQLEDYYKFLVQQSKDKIVILHNERRKLMGSVQRLLFIKTRTETESELLDRLLNELDLEYDEDGLLTMTERKAQPRRYTGPKEPKKGLFEREVEEDVNRMRILKRDLKLLDNWMEQISKVRHKVSNTEENVPDWKGTNLKFKQRTNKRMCDMERARIKLIKDSYHDYDRSLKNVIKPKGLPKGPQLRDKKSSSKRNQKYTNLDSQTATIETISGETSKRGSVKDVKHDSEKVVNELSPQDSSVAESVVKSASNISQSSRTEVKEILPEKSSNNNEITHINFDLRTYKIESDKTSVEEKYSKNEVKPVTGEFKLSGTGSREIPEEKHSKLKGKKEPGSEETFVEEKGSKDEAKPVTGEFKLSGTGSREMTKKEYSKLEDGRASETKEILLKKRDSKDEAEPISELKLPGTESQKFSEEEYSIDKGKPEFEDLDIHKVQSEESITKNENSLCQDEVQFLPQELKHSKSGLERKFESDAIVEDENEVKIIPEQLVLSETESREMSKKEYPQINVKDEPECVDLGTHEAEPKQPVTTDENDLGHDKVEHAPENSKLPKSEFEGKLDSSAMRKDEARPIPEELAMPKSEPHEISKDNYSKLDIEGEPESEDLDIHEAVSKKHVTKDENSLSEDEAHYPSENLKSANSQLRMMESDSNLKDKGEVKPFADDERHSTIKSKESIQKEKIGVDNVGKPVSTDLETFRTESKEATIQEKDSVSENELQPVAKGTEPYKTASKGSNIQEDNLFGNEDKPVSEDLKSSITELKEPIIDKKSSTLDEDKIIFRGLESNETGSKEPLNQEKAPSTEDRVKSVSEKSKSSKVMSKEILDVCESSVSNIVDEDKRIGEDEKVSDPLVNVKSDKVKDSTCSLEIKPKKIMGNEELEGKSTTELTTSELSPKALPPSDVIETSEESPEVTLSNIPASDVSHSGSLSDSMSKKDKS